MEPQTIAVVLDPDYGERLFQLAQIGPVWLTASETNRAAAEKYWRSKGDSSNEVTYWSAPRTGATEEEWLDILDLLELHHSKDWAGPGIAKIVVVGAPPTSGALAALKEFGYGDLTALPDGFEAVRLDAGKRMSCEQLNT